MNWRERFSFLKKALGSSKEVGAITMSSQYVVDDVLAMLPKNFSTVVEYGAGDGVMTRALLERLPVTGKMLAVESNESFITELGRINDPRLTIIQNLVQNMTSEDMALYSSADVVVSSIPFSFLSPVERAKVVSEVFNLLAPGGLCIIFHQYSWLMKKPLQDVFGAVSMKFEPRNIPPCFILCAKKS